MWVYLYTKFQVASIILTSFRPGRNLPPPPLPHHHYHLKRTPIKPTQIRVKEALVINLDEKRASTSRKYVSNMYSKFIRQTNLFWFLIQKSSLKIWIFRAFLPPKEALVASFRETGTPISRRYVAEEGLIIPKLSETLESSPPKFFVFALENSLKISILTVFYLCKKLWWLFSMKHLALEALVRGETFS